MKAKIVAMISGVVWTLIAAGILQDRSTFGRLSGLGWWACLAGPLIGLAIYYLARPSYTSSVAVRVLWAVFSLYLATGFYGVALGAVAALHPRPHEETWQCLIGTPLMCWWGITFMPTLWPLFGVSYFNHFLLARYEKQAYQSDAANRR
jgi:hypothetical protein